MTQFTDFTVNVLRILSLFSTSQLNRTWHVL